jgi:hypothetical protein
MMKLTSASTAIPIGAKVKEEDQEDREDQTSEELGRQRWVRVHTLPSRLYGDQVKDILESEGIPALLKGEDVGIFGPGAGYGTSILGITVWVPEDYEHRAKELIVAYLDGI